MSARALISAGDAKRTLRTVAKEHQRELRAMKATARPRSAPDAMGRSHFTITWTEPWDGGARVRGQGWFGTEANVRKLFGGHITVEA
jgi:hypothetical protein